MATTFQIAGGAVFPEGTSVGVYPRSAWGVESVSGAPTGSPVTTQTITSGTATFTGLTTNTQYYAYANVGGQHRIKGFNTADPPTTGGGGAPTGAAGGDLAGTYPNPTLNPGLADPAAGTAGLRTLGTGAQQAAGGTDARLSDTRTPTDLSVTAAKVADGAIQTRKLADLARTGGWLPTGAIDATVVDREATSTITAAGGILWLAGGITIPGGRAVSSITSCSGATAGAGLTHLWFCLVDQSLNVVATTVDDVVVNGVTAWAANTPKTLLLATTLGGATPGGTYTPTNAIEVYVGLMVTGTTSPAVVSAGGASSTGPASMAPMLAGTSTTGLTTPASLGATAAAMTVQAKRFYAHIS